MYLKRAFVCDGIIMLWICVCLLYKDNWNCNDVSKEKWLFVTTSKVSSFEKKRKYKCLDTNKTICKFSPLMSSAKYKNLLIAKLEVEKSFLFSYYSFAMINKIYQMQHER